MPNPQIVILPVRHRPGEGGSRAKDPSGMDRRKSVLSAVCMSNPPDGPDQSKRSASKGFTIVEVMMASVILVVGFIGMISAVTVGSEMLATAKRQNLATQIINHELERLRLVDFATIDAYAVGPTTLTIDSQFNTAVASCGLTTDTSVSTNPYIKVERSVSDVVSGGLCQVTITVTWQKSGTTTAATTATGSWLQKLSFGGQGPIQRTYVRKGFGFFGKYGLNLNTQRS